MKTIRNGVFETNSSSCHCATLISKEELKDFAGNQYCMCIYLPDTGDYQTGSEYKIMSIDDAFKQYNESRKKFNESRFVKEHPDCARYVYSDDEKGMMKFEDDLERNYLSREDGVYLTFGNFMAHALIESDMKFDVTWWNNCD